MNSMDIRNIKEVKNVDLWVHQIWFWRTHLDVFIEDYFQIELKDTQKVVARAIGNCDDLDIVKSRGYGKTWLIAICAIALGVLYPGSLIMVASGTAEQATLILQKIDDKFLQNENVMREIETGRHKAVVITQSRGECILKCGSKIRSSSVRKLRGQRAKVAIIDEAPEVKENDLTAIIFPIRNETREVCYKAGFKDYTSKMISITSACLKSNYFYQNFVEKYREFQKGNPHVFACALDYQSAARAGITDMEFFLKERKRMAESKFAMEYGSIFIGAEAGSWFPYSLTETCRTLEEVETMAPAKSQTSYIISIDLATSQADYADNAVFTVLKKVEREDGSYLKKVVYIRSFHGKKLDYLAKELRKLLVRFPKTDRVVFDHRGLGDAFPRFLSQPWIDPETGQEYPPLVLDNEQSIIHNAMPLLHSVIATQQINQAMATALRVALEQRTIEFPVSSRRILNGHLVHDEDEDDIPLEETDPKQLKKRRTLSTEEKAVFVEMDAMQVEMGYIVARVSQAGTYTYDTAKTNQHKDRYSSVAMGVLFLSEEEDKRIRRIAMNKMNDDCVGVVDVF